MRELGLFSVVKQRLKGNLINVYKYQMGGCNGRARHFAVVPCGKTRDNGHNLKYRQFHLNIRKTFFTVKVVKHWKRSLRELVESLSLEILKTQLATALSNLL